jgi:hypothetical protein
VTWQKEKGGAGITANHGKWEHVKASFPLHNLAANRALLSRWSKTTIFTAEDLDAIRALFGEKVSHSLFQVLLGINSLTLSPSGCILLRVYAMLLFVPDIPCSLRCLVLVLLRVIFSRLRSLQLSLVCGIC